MEERTLNFFAESCGGRLLNGARSEAVARGVSTDSRSVAAGELFVALRGESFDAHQFLGDVCARGAAAALVEESQARALPPAFPGIAVENTRNALGRIGAAYRAQFRLDAIAVGGSNGKTSTKELLAAVLRERFPVVASAASFNNDVGVPLTLLQIERRHEAGVFEAGTNHPGELKPLLEMIRPNIGIITSIGREHLEHFGDLEGVLEEEAALAATLPVEGILVLNGDAFGAERLAARTRARVITAGHGPRNDWRITGVRLGPDGSHFEIATAEPEFCGEYRTRLLGAHQAVNAACALVVGRNLGLGRAEIQRGLASCSGAKRRLELKHIDDFLVLDDAYNANADSMRAALETLQRFPCRGRRIAVLGDMAELGATSDPAHAEVGRHAVERRIDCLVAVGRSSGLMAGAAREAGLQNVFELPEVETAGPAVREIVRPGDVVLVKASRATRLERVVEFLSAHFGTREQPAMM